MKETILTLTCMMFALPCFGFDVTAHPANPTGGEAFVLTIAGNTTGQFKVNYEKNEYMPYAVNDRKSCIVLPVGIEEYGTKVINVKRFNAGEVVEEKNIEIDAQKRVLEVVKLTGLDEKMRDKQPMIQEQNDKLLEILKYKSTLRLWKSPFMRPLNSSVSTQFATHRKGKTYAYFHKGIDISAEAGTPIKATNSGKVVFSKQNLNVYGNTMVIDHGQGVVSCYFHLGKLLKKEGQVVKKGAVIAKVGSSGWATGPHLHFGIYIQGVAVDPIWWEDFTKKDIFKNN